jgi:Flp pilus assembly protein TadG
MFGFAAFAKRVSRFRQAEEGALIIFALFLFVLMMMIGGVAVDFMRYEQQRTSLMNTLDRGVLAATALNQQLDPDSVVRDYFAKANLNGQLDDVTVTAGINGRVVKAMGTVDTQPIFLHMVGIDKLDAKGASVAEQRVNNVEIILVLDVSGSMGNNNKLVNLKAAANEFVDTVLASDPNGRISIGIVPFNGQVNLGATLAGKYNLTNNPNIANVNCVDLANSVYASTAMSNTVAMSMTAHADTFSGTNQSANYVSATDANFGAPNPANRWCPPVGGNIVRLPSKSSTDLHSSINGLTAIGATSINAGMKWGMALLDPASRPMFTQLIGAGAISNDFNGRPFNYNEQGTMKVVVLMTDGEHFAEERVNETYKSGNSPIYRSNGDGNYSIQFTTGRPAAAGANQYWVPHLCVSNSCTSGADTSQAWRSTPWNSGAGTTQQTWQQVWTNMRVSYVSWQFYARALGTAATRSTVYSNTLANFRTQTATGSMDGQLQQICGLSKGKDVTVYGIAFEAPANGQSQISQCASSPAHYFNAQGLQISTAFRTIATNITQLRLTQ